MKADQKFEARGTRGRAVDIETRRKKQRALMVQMVERKVRSRAQQLYEARGHGEGAELEDWFQAESEIIGKNALTRLYGKIKGSQESPTAANDLSSKEDYSSEALV